LNLATDEDVRVREWVARNPYAPFAALTLLTADEDPFVRIIVARTPYLPRDLKAVLMRDPDWWVCDAASGGLPARQALAWLPQPALVPVGR
jgi:hypothetical protein